MSLNVRGEGKQSSEEATSLYLSGVGINSMVQEVQHNCMEVIECLAVTFMFSWLYSSECRKQGEGKPQKVSWQMSNEKEEMKLQSSDLIVVLE